MMKTDLVFLWEQDGELRVTEPAPGAIVRRMAAGFGLVEAIESIAESDILPHVTTPSNRPAYIVCRRSQLPDSRAYRNAWRRADAMPD